MTNYPLTALESMWFYEIIAANLKVTARDLVLDIGCGGGYTCFKFAERARRVVGVDISAPLIQYLIAFNRKHNIDFLLSDVCSEAFISQHTGCFSRVCSSDVLEHVDDPARFVLAISRVLSEKARAVLTFPNHTGHGRHRFQTVSEIEDLFAQAGLRADVCSIKMISVYKNVWDIYSLGRKIYKCVTGQKPDRAYKPSEDVFHHYSLFEQMMHPRWYHYVAKGVMALLISVSKLGPLYGKVEIAPDGQIDEHRVLVIATAR